MTKEIDCIYCGDVIEEGQEMLREDDNVFCCNECLNNYREDKK